jgi:hypothetical protein
MNRSLDRERFGHAGVLIRVPLICLVAGVW